MNNRLLNWLSDDGITIRMLKDHTRNQFYDQALKEIVPGKRCIDVGFGTGILSLLALKHGAKSIRAYESNTERYELGLYIISQLGLENQIELINSSFNSSCILPTDDLIFHEIIGAVLYSEGLRCTFNDQIPVCPAEYHTDFMLFEIDQTSIESLKLAQSDNYAVNRMQKEFLSLKDQIFSTGIDIDDRYNKIVSGLIDDYFDYQTHTRIHKLSPKTVSDFTPVQQKLFESFGKQAGTLACSITADYKEKNKYIETTISKDLLKNKTVVVVPHCYFSNNGHRVNIQEAHWNARMRWQESAILDQVDGDVHIRQSLVNGHIIYWT
jgi:hypothetical protein